MSYQSSQETPTTQSRRFVPPLQSDSETLLETVEVSAPSARESSRARVLSDLSVEPMAGLSPVYEADDQGIDPGQDSITDEELGESVHQQHGLNPSVRLDQANNRNERHIPCN